jgi:branched-chain amino acid transport system permease protein
MIEAVSSFFASYSNVISLCLLNSILAYGVFLALSANMFTLATGGFMALGAYCSVYMTMRLDLPFGAAALAGALLAALAAGLIGMTVLRLRGDYFMLATFAFTEVVRVAALNWEDFTGGAIGIVGIPQYTKPWQLAVVLAALILLTLSLRASYIGRAISAVRRDETVARVMGVDVFSYRLWLFIASGFVTGGAGAFAAHLNFFIGPSDFGLGRSVDALTYPILGGVNSIAGPITGAVFSTLLPEITRSSAQAREILMGALVLAVVLFLPGGITSLFRRGKIARPFRIAPFRTLGAAKAESTRP